MSKLKIACDVQGTLVDGPRTKQILAILRALIADGHYVVIWSGNRRMADEFVRNNNLTSLDGRKWIPSREKFSKTDALNQGESLFDLAIEDERNQLSWLASKYFMLVNEIAEDETKAVEEAMEHLAWIQGG